VIRPGIFQILEWPRDVQLLRRKARDVRPDEFDTDALKKFGASLAETMMRAGGLGLASTQVRQSPSDDAQCWRMVAIRVDELSYGVFCNPVVVMKGEERVGIEGCLSFASVGEPMGAPDMVMFDFRNMAGVEGRTAFSDDHARCIVHEMDHLDGKVIVDRMGPMARRMFMQRVAKVRARKAAAT
jgi:peptide deformylase